MKMDNMDNMPMQKPQSNLVKTIANNTPSRTVRYDLYVNDTIVNDIGG